LNGYYRDEDNYDAGNGNFSVKITKITNDADDLGLDIPGLFRVELEERPEKGDNVWGVKIYPGDDRDFTGLWGTYSIELRVLVLNSLLLKV